MRQLRSLLAAGDTDGAWALAESLLAQDETRMLGHVAAGITAYRRGFAELAHEQLRAVPRELWTVHAAPAYARGGLAAAPEETLGELRALVADEPPGVPVRTWYDIAVAAFGYGDEALARSAFEAFERGLRADPGWWREGARHADWLRPWIAADGSSPTAPPPEGGRRSFAVMDYGHPGANRASANIGDHIQTVAALGHLVRHRGVRLHGAPELVALLDELGERVRPERRRDDVDADLEVLTVHRDASMYEADPRGHVDAVLRLVHARDLRDAARVPAARQPAPDLRLVPLQQAQPADPGGGRVPQALRTGGLPRLDDGRPAALARRAGLLLGLRDDDDRHRVPRTRLPAGRRPGRVCRRPGGGGRRPLPPQLDPGPPALVRGQRAGRARRAGDVSHPPPQGGHVAPALLPPRARPRRRRRVPPGQPLRHPLRRAGRDRRPCVDADPRGSDGEARGGHGRDPRRPPGGRRLCPVARAHRRRRGRGARAPRAAGAAAGPGRRPRRAGRAHRRRDGHARAGGGRRPGSRCTSP